MIEKLNFILSYSWSQILFLLIPTLCIALYYAIIRLFDIKLFLTSNKVVKAMGLPLCLATMVVYQIKADNPPYFIYGILILTLVNVIDDLVEVYYVWRLMIQFIACSFLLMQNNLFYSYWSPLLLIVTVGYLNAFNFMDGINGMVSGYSLAILIPLLVVLKNLDFSFSLSIIIALIAFLFFNFRLKEKAWLGDTGSMGLAFIILNLVFSNFKGYQLYMFLSLASIFIIDAGITLLQRQLSNENVFTRHHKHFYQYIRDYLNWDVRLISFIYFAVQFSINLILLSSNSRNFNLFFTITSTVIILLVYIVLKGKIESKLLSKKSLQD